MAAQQASTPPPSLPSCSTQHSPPSSSSDCHQLNVALDPNSSPLAAPPLLRGDNDLYEGIIVDSSSLPSDVPAFVQSLRASLAHWKSEHKRGVWLKIPIENADLVPAAVKEGFGYHHAEPTYVMMTYWIPESPSTLPMNASHQVGVGAFVINDQREVLVVQERNGPLKGAGIWKMPTGIVNQGEEIFDGAKREVKEETGVDTEFIEVVGFRFCQLVKPASCLI